ncbi:MAG: NCS2 family permease [Bacteroidales bacterium]|nr:NCS2 family permease [Bacteroidales bacterium]
MLNKLFGLNPKETNVKTEVIAGLTTFLTMAYILAVNPNILSATGMDRGALFSTTVFISAAATILMGLYAKLPFALAPGMGLNAFFAYTICLIMGYSWQFALTAVFIEGLIFILLTVTNIREKIVDVIPEALKKSISVGIGIYIAFIGLSSAEIVVNNDATLVSIGDLTRGPALLCIIGIVVSSVLLIKKVPGALLIGIIVTTLIGIPFGVTQFNGVISVPPSVEPILCKFDWAKIFTPEMFVIVFTLLFVDLFDTIGTLIGVATRAGMIKNGKIPRLKQAFMVDALATTSGAIMGTSTVTTYVESAAGVEQGGRSGLTAFVCGLCFLVSLFFAPLFLSIPSAATAPVLVLVGVMMMSSVVEINFREYSEAIPAFICFVMMPLCYSISDGIVLGMLSYVIINLCAGKYNKLSIGMYILSAFFLLKFLV